MREKKINSYGAKFIVTSCCGDCLLLLFNDYEMIRCQSNNTGGGRDSGVRSEIGGRARCAEFGRLVDITLLLLSLGLLVWRIIGIVVVVSIVFVVVCLFFKLPFLCVPFLVFPFPPMQKQKQKRRYANSTSTTIFVTLRSLSAFSAFSFSAFFAASAA